MFNKKFIIFGVIVGFLFTSAFFTLGNLIAHGDSSHPVTSEKTHNLNEYRPEKSNGLFNF